MREFPTVLLVDDDEDLTRGMKLRFLSAGYKTLVANSAESGLRAARTQRPQVIVMDVRMNDGSGIDAVEELKLDGQTEQIPIVMLSGCIGAEQQSLETGARFFVRKPFSGEQILTAVEVAIKESQQSTTNLI